MLVVNVCTGVPAPGVVTRWDRLTGAADSARAMELRLAEDDEALALAGRGAVGLGFLDAQYREGPLAADELRAALADATPEGSPIHAPAGIGAHADHVVVRDAAFELARSRGVPLTLYADLPYAAMPGWPEWVTGAGAADERWEGSLATAPCPRDALSVRVIRLTGDERAAKLRSLGAYRTQFPALLPGPLDLGFEVQWDVALA